MEDNLQTQNQQPPSSSDSVRSASYPFLTIEEAYDFALKINAQFSSVAKVSREEIANGFKMNPGSIIRDIASCVQFGFLSKIRSEAKYQLTQLFVDIFQPDSPRDKKIALIKSFGMPKLYSELISRYDNNVVPEELPNTLIKYHSIRKEVAKTAADTFIKSGEYVGVFNENRLLKYAVTLSTTEKTQYAAIIEDVPASDTNSPNEAKHFISVPAPKTDSKNINIPIYLLEGKVAAFSYPENLTEDDMELIKHQMEGILLRIKLAKKKGEQSPS